MRTNGYLSLPSLFRVLVLALILNSAGCCCVGTGWLANRAGIRQYNRGHYALAKHRFARAVAHDPCNPDYRHNLAMAIQKQGDAGGCEQILRTNLQLDAMHQPTYHSLAQLMVAQGRAPEAQELITTWAATQPYVPEANIEMAWIQRESGDVSGAENSLQTALRSDPSNPIALAHLGQLYQTEGRVDQATAYYQRSLAANWNQPEVQSRLATLLESGPTSRSALMQNMASTRMMANNPGGFGDPMLAGTPMMTASSAMSFSPETQIMAMDEGRMDRRPRRRGRAAANETIVGSYPMPNYDAVGSGWSQEGVIPASATTVYQPTSAATDPVTMSQVNLPPLVPPQGADTVYSPFGSATTPTPIAQADPAHADDSSPDMTAGLPLVDPH